MARFGFRCLGCEAKNLGGGTQVQIFYLSGGHKDVSRPEIELLVDLHEAGGCVVCQAVFDLK